MDCDCDNFFKYYIIGLCLIVLVVIVAAIIEKINDIKEEKNKELRSRILFSGEWIYYKRDEKGEWVDWREERKKEGRKKERKN